MVEIVQPEYVLAVLDSGKSLIAKRVRIDGVERWQKPVLAELLPNGSMQFTRLLVLCLNGEEMDALKVGHGALHIDMPQPALVNLYEQGTRMAASGLVQAAAIPSL